jgi:hypothetical protein
VSKEVEQAVANSTPARRTRTSATLRLGLEFALLFSGTMLVKQILASAVSAPYPNLLWLPVAVLTVQKGLAWGLVAAVIASGLQYAGGLPPELMGEDIYSYIGRIAAEPIAWTCFALVFGHIRSRQIAHAAELEAQLAERNRQCTSVADLCDELRQRIEVLERQIAAAGQLSSADMVQAAMELNHAAWDDFAERLTRFVVLMTGCPEFTIHLLRADALAPALQPMDDHRPAAHTPISRGDPLFEAIVSEGRVLTTRQAGDSAILAARGVMAGPLVDGKHQKDIIGMFAIGGAALDDCPEDIERRFSLVLSELSRLSGHLRLVERWHAARPASLNGQDKTGERQVEPAMCAAGKSVPPTAAEPDRQIVLQ